MKINESRTSPTNFRSISPQAKWDRTFDEIWAVKKKTEFFSLTSKMVVLPFLSLFSYLWWLRKIGRRRRKKILFLILLYKGPRGLKFWAFHIRKNPTLPNKIRMWGGSVRMKDESEMCKRRTCIHSPRERDCQDHLIRE